MGVGYPSYRPTTWVWCQRCNASAGVQSDKAGEWKCDCPAWRKRLDAILWLPTEIELWWRDKLVSLLRRYANWLEDQ